MLAHCVDRLSIKEMWVNVGKGEKAFAISQMMLTARGGCLDLFVINSHHAFWDSLITLVYLLEQTRSKNSAGVVLLNFVSLSFSTVSVQKKTKCRNELSP